MNSLPQLVTVLLLSAALAFGQMPMTKEQKRDCSKATKAFKAQPVPNPSLADFMALSEAMRQACGTPEDYAARHTKAAQAIDEDTRKTINKIRSLEVPQDSPASSEEISKELDAAVETQNSQPLDIHELLTQKSTAFNREIALANRLIAHLQRAQVWEGIDAEHPEAVALREKIAQEEKELVASFAEVSFKDRERVKKECTVEEINSLTRLVQEATGVMQDVKTQQDRYHALGY